MSLAAGGVTDLATRCVVCRTYVYLPERDQAEAVLTHLRGHWQQVGWAPGGGKERTAQAGCRDTGLHGEESDEDLVCYFRTRCLDRTLPSHARTNYLATWVVVQKALGRPVGWEMLRRDLDAQEETPE